MNKKTQSYKGDLPSVPGTEIYINVNKLEKGEYTLKIVNKYRLLKQTTFKKE